MKISAIIITRNEEKNLEECMKTLEFADEIIVVDNGSKDQTVALAKKLNALVFEIPGLDFSYLRNIGKEKSSSDWLFYIDADERVTPELAQEIKSTLAENPKNCAYSVIRKNYFLGKPSPNLEKINRLIKKDALIGWQGSLHESAIIAGNPGNLNSYLLHHTHRDISSMIVKTNEWSDVEAQLLYKSNHPIMRQWRFMRIIATVFFRSFVSHKGYKMGVVGLIESIYQSFSNFITYAKLWEKQNRSVR